MAAIMEAGNERGNGELRRENVQNDQEGKLSNDPRSSSSSNSKTTHSM